MMIRTILVVWALVLASAPARAQVRDSAGMDTAYAPGPYRVFTGSGEAASLDDIVRAMGAVQVVFIGETHDDPTAHLIELELLKRAAESHAAARPIALSLEFFERDVQLPIDEYLAGRIPESSFRADTRPWPRYETDYRPLLEFAKAHRLPVIAANAPRRYVSMVSRRGRESLSELDARALALLPPLPYGRASVAYREQWIATMSEVMKREGMRCGVRVDDAPAPTGAHQNMGNQLDGQVLWDATMAHSVARVLSERPDALVLHMAGGFHVERGTGTPEQLQAYAPGTRALIVSIRPVDDVSAYAGAPDGQWGDFVVQTESARTLEAIECRQFHAERGSYEAVRHRTPDR
ncbi:MAG TPA: ChaN family lipoprotein [Longimicrobiales bacterium]